jgi:hypothetical protein
MSKSRIISIFTFILTFFIVISGCINRNEKQSKSVTDVVETVPVKNEIRKIKKVTYYLENSASMFGYVNGPSEYISVVTELAGKPEFVEEDVLQEFHYINGGQNLHDILIGKSPDVLKKMLNRKGFTCGDITKSNLNGMFQIALDKAGGDTVSILISDCIYDVGETGATFTVLNIEGIETKGKFIKRLQEANIQTIIIKLYSKFTGDYFYTSKKGGIFIDQQRPFYVLIFGESELLSRYFSEEYISNQLEGFNSMSRFLKIDNVGIPYQATTLNKKGTFKFDRKNRNKLTGVERNRSGEDFQFSFAVDFSSLPFSDKYLMVKDNFVVTKGNYTITGISRQTNPIYGLSFTATHLVTLKTDNNPYGDLEITLLNNIPGWIDETNVDNEIKIEEDSTKTFGFKYLTDAITEAYQYKNKQKNITTFNFEILK